MSDRGGLADLGRHVYGLAAVALGIIGLVFGDFANVWQPVPPLICPGAVVSLILWPS